MRQAVADAGVVPSDHSPGGSGAGAAHGGEGGAVLLGSRRSVAAAEAFEVGPVELPPEFACNNRNVFISMIWRSTNGRL
jgi:hypothetical protein